MLIPKTRKEIYQVYLSGDTDLELPKPVTRDEIILYNACINGAGVPPAGGGGGYVDVVFTLNSSGNFKSSKTFEEIVSESGGDASKIRAIYVNAQGACYDCIKWSGVTNGTTASFYFLDHVDASTGYYLRLVKVAIGVGQSSGRPNYTNVTAPYSGD